MSLLGEPLPFRGGPVDVNLQVGIGPQSRHGRRRATTSLVPLIRDGGTLAAVAGLATDTPTEGLVNVETVRCRHEPAILAELAAAMVKGDLVILIARRLPLSQAVEGHRIAASSPGGKVVLLP
jgi:hypothetical protein